MAGSPLDTLSRREREIMQVVYQLGEANTAEVVAQLRDDPAYDTVRVTLGILERKTFLTHRKDGRRYVYRPTVSHTHAARGAVRDLLKTFFGGSPSRAIVTMLDMSADRLSAKELDEVAAWLKQHKQRGPKP